MKNKKFKTVFSKFTLFSLLLFTICGNGVQINYSQGKPNLSNTNTTEQKPKPSEKSAVTETEDKTGLEKSGVSDSAQKSDRVIVNTNVELIEDSSCECAFIATSSGGFPLYGFFAIGGIAFVPVALNAFDDEPPSGPNNVVSPSSP